MNTFNQTWSSVKASCENNKTIIEVWGRKYTFDNSLYPTSINILGNDILFAPMTIHAFFDDVEGIPVDTKHFIIEKCNEKVVFLVTQTIENIIINGRVTIEFDGFIDYSLSIIPFWSYSPNNQNIPRLNKLYIDIPIKSEYSNLYHYWPNDTNSVVPAADKMNSGALNKNLSLEFKPFIWSGWEDGGIGFCMESDKSIEVDGPHKIIQFTRETHTNIQINLLSHMPLDWAGRADKWDDTLNPIEYRFGIQATPVKPERTELLKNWRPFHIGYVVAGNMMPFVKKELDKIASNNVNWIILHEDWSIIQNYGLAENEDEFKELVNLCHQKGIKVMVYFGYEYSTLAPDWHINADNYLNKSVNGNFTGGWQRNPQQRDYIACYQGGYAKVMQDRVKFVMDEYGVDGIYTDGTFVPWECANSSHNCGYTDRSEKMHATFPILAVREHVKKLYEIVHERGGIIDTHQSTCCLDATLAFCDSYYDGENIQSAFKKDFNKFLTLEAFRSEYMGKNHGLTCNLIANTTDFNIEDFAGISLLHNVFPRACDFKSLDYMSKIWKIYMDFDTDSAIFHPYWDKSCPAKSHNDKVFISCYEKPDKLLLVIVTFDEQIKNTKITYGLHNETVNLKTYHPSIIVVENLK